MTQYLNPFSGRQFVDANGAPYSGAKLFVYTAGTSTKYTATKDQAGTSNHANPIILNSRGEPSDAGGASQPIWQAGGVSVKLVLAPSTDTDPPGSPISTWDNIAGINDASVSADQWITGPTPTYVSTTSFTLVGDQTSTFHIGRRVKTTNSGGTVYSTITASAYTTLTTITVANDSGSLDSGLSVISYGLFSASNTSWPPASAYTINGLTEDTAPDRGADYLLSYDTSATAAKKVKIDTLVRYEARRQTVVAGAVDSNGQANFLSAGTGLAVTMAATATPVIATFANGEDEVGPINFRKRFTADQANYWSGLAASNVSYLLLDRDTTTGAVTPYSTMVPPQYGAAFDKFKQEILTFDGANGSTTITSTFGWTWTAYGNAQIQSNKLSLDGAGDYIENAQVTTLGDGGWTLEGDYTFSVLPAAASRSSVVLFSNASNYGAYLALYNNAGTIKSEVYLSSNGTAYDISNGGVGTKTSWVAATKYHFALTYDPTAGKIYVYVDGVLDQTITTSSKICALAKAGIGSNGAAGSYLNGTVENFRYSPCCRYPAGATFAPPATAFTPDAEWFDLSNFTWKFGGPTTGWTTKQRVCVGEATTGAASVSSVTTYALRGEYYAAGIAIPAAGTKTTVVHNIGCSPPREVMLSPRCKTAEQGYAVGDEIIHGGMGGNGTYSYKWGMVKTRTSLSFITGAPTAFGSPNLTTGSDASLTAGNWEMTVAASRGW